MSKTIAYCLAGCCVAVAAIGLAKTSSEKTAPEPRDSKVESICKRSSVRPRLLTFSSRNGSTYSSRGINPRPARVNAEVADVPKSPGAEASVTIELEEEISLLTQLGTTVPSDSLGASNDDALWKVKPLKGIAN